MQIAVVAACFYLAGGFTSLVTAHAVDGFPRARTDIPTVSFFLGFFVRVSLGFRWAVSDTHDQLLANRAMTNICSLQHRTLKQATRGSQSVSPVVLVEYLVSSLQVSSLSSTMTLFNIYSASCLPPFSSY